MRAYHPLFALSSVLIAIAACTADPNALTSGGGAGSSSSSGGASSSSGSTSSSGSNVGDDGGTLPGNGGPDGSMPTPPACKPGLTSVPLALTPSPDGPVRAAPMPDGGTVVAWAGGGAIHLRHVDAAGKPVGTDSSVPGNTVHGIAPMTGAVALLVARSPDVLALVKVVDGGTVGFEKVIVGNSNHDTVGSEWFDFQPEFFSESGRLAWDGSKLSVYAPIFRHWPDGISHTGDTLRTFDGDGNVAPGNGWDWGCSHSLDLRLSPDGKKQVCLSDCYPQKGIMIARQDLVSSEPSGNCAGSSDAKLGGLATVGADSWITMASREGRTSRDVALVKLGQTTKHWLTQNGDAEAPHLAPYAKGMLAGWRIGNASTVQALDAQGNPVGAAQDVSSLAFGEGDDFLAWPGGDAGWLAQGNGGFKIARLGACE